MYDRHHPTPELRPRVRLPRRVYSLVDKSIRSLLPFCVSGGVIARVSGRSYTHKHTHTTPHETNVLQDVQESVVYPDTLGECLSVVCRCVVSDRVTVPLPLLKSLPSWKETCGLMLRRLLKSLPSGKEVCRLMLRRRCVVTSGFHFLFIIYFLVTSLS